MAKISTYGPDGTLTNKDKVLGSSYVRTVAGVDEFETKNFTLEELNSFFTSEGSALSIGLKDNGGIVRETIDNVTKLAIDLGASSITGQLANSDLANSSITINGTAISLGGTVTTPNTQLTDAQVRSKISVTGGGSYNSSTGVITIPAGFTLAQGNVTNASVSGQTLTLTRQSDSDVTFTPTANDFTNTLKTKLDNIESNATADQTATEIRTLVEAATDSNVFTDDDHTKLNNIEANATADQTASEIKTLYESNSDTNAFTDADHTKLDNIEANATADQTNAEIRTAVEAATDSNVFTDDDHTKLDGIAAGAEVNVQANWNESTSTSDAFIQNKPTLFVGTDISASTDNDAKGIYVTANAASATIGLDVDGLTELTTADFNDDFLIVYDNNVQTNKKIHPENIIPGATSSRRGGIKIGYTESGKNYPVELDSEKAYVNVPWTDTNTQLSTEEVQDIIGGMVSGNTETNISVTYDDTNGKLDFASTDTNTQLTDEQVQDIVGAMVSGNTESNVTVTYDDTNGKLDFTASGTQLSKETVQDYVGEMLSGNTETRIAVTYDDTNNKINFVADDQSYTLPTASSSTLGGVKVGSNLTISNGVLDVAAIALTTVQTAANETAHLALTAQEGDVVVRSDENKSYVKNSGTAGTMADYTELLTPTDAVTSVTTSDSTYIDMTPNSPATGAITVTAALSAVDGTSDTTDRFLTKDNKWAVPSYTTDTNTFRTVQADGTSIGATETLNLIGGTNVTLSENNGAITIAATDTDTNTFRTVEVDSNGNGSANSTLEASETLRFKKGSNVTLSEASGVITISSTDTNTTYDVMGSGNSYAAGLVLAGASSHGGAFLRKDGSWQVPPDNNDNTTYTAGTGLTLSGTTFNANVDGTNSEAAQNSTTTSGRTYKVQVDSSDNLVVNVPWTDTDTDTDTNTTYDLSVPASTTKIRLAGSDSTNDDVEIAGGTNVTVTRNSASKMTIAATDTNTFRTVEVDGSAIGATETLDLVAGNNITLSESNGEVTIDATDTNTQLSTEQVQDIVGGMVSSNTETNIAVTYDDTNGKLNFVSTDTNTTYTAGHGLQLSGTEFQWNYGIETTTVTGSINSISTTSGRYYAVQADDQDRGELVVNVPWTDNNTTYTAGNGLSLSGTQFSADINYISYSGSNNFIEHGTQNEEGNTIPTGGVLVYLGTTNQKIVERATVGDLPFLSSSGGTVSGDLSLTGHISLLDNKYIKLGTGTDFLARHDGTDTTFVNVTGDYYIQNQAVDKDLYLGINDNSTVRNLIMLDGSASQIKLLETTLIQDGSGNADLYLGNIIGPSSSDKGARFHSNNSDFYMDFQGDSTQNWFLRDYDGSGGTHTRFAFDFVNGKFTAGGDVVAFGSPSDKTLKENIKPIDNALDKVEKLQGVTFDWKEQDITNLKEDIGFIAQDVKEVLPELVRENENGKLSLRHQGIIPVLLEAIKELSDKVKALENGGTK